MTTNARPTPPASGVSPAVPGQRPYVAPALVTHGDVQALTQGKIGPASDQDNGGSFPAGANPDDDAAGG